jgi:ABC-type thiamin/hydroxymethylpyrimidine transport system permease subunit
VPCAQGAAANAAGASWLQSLRPVRRVAELGPASIERVEYSGTVMFVLFGLWAVASLLLAWFVRRRFYACFGSVAMAAPVIAYASLGPGSMESGGIIQALCAGIYVLPFHYFFQRLRSHRRQKMEPR